MIIKRFLLRIIPNRILTYIVSVKNHSVYYFRRIKANKYLKHSLVPISSMPVKVGFIVQMPEVWDKESPIFEEMLFDSRFDPYLLVLPSYNFTKSDFNVYGNELEYFKKKYNNEKIICLFDNGWIDLKKFNFSYVFYQRCWERYVPKQYHTKYVARYAKTCYIPYATGMNDGIQYYRTSFFTYLYICFCSTKEQVFFHPNNKFQKILYLGSPVLETFMGYFESNKITNNNKCILWTPRWTNDSFFGGSSFLRDMNNILTLKTRYLNIDLVLRPHPLVFPNAIKEGYLSEDDVINYRNKVNELGVNFDDNEFVEKTFLKTDILITDYSSIILEFFLTGKPIVFCSKTNIDFEPIFKRISDCFYIADNWHEIECIVDDLINGIDPLIDKRKALIECLVNENNGSTKSIVNYIYNNYLSYNN